MSYIRVSPEERKVLATAKLDAYADCEKVHAADWDRLVSALRLAPIDPGEVFNSLSPHQQRVVMRLAFYAAKRLETYPPGVRR